MTQLARQTTTPDRPGTPRRTRYAHVAARVLLAVIFLSAAFAKLSGDASMETMFDDLGGGDRLRLFVGCAELAGAVGLFIPRLRRFAALGLGLLMIGAGVASVAMLDDNPLVPAVLVVVAAFAARGPSAGRPHL